MSPQLQLMLQQAIQAFQGGNFESAELLLKRILHVEPKNLPALHVLGLIKASQSKYKEAADYLSKAARIHPADASIQYNLAKALADSGNEGDALIHHKKAVALAPNNPEAWLNYGRTASNLGRYEDALVSYTNALALRPDYAEAALNKGATLKELKRYEESLIFTERALEINPGLAEAWSNKGVALKELRRYEEAITHYDKALSLKPDYYEAWTNKGSSLHELKRFNDAITHYDKALSLKPDYYEAWTNKGLTLSHLKRYEEAVNCYDKALDLKVDLYEALVNKGTSLVELRKYDEAINHYDKALNLKSGINWIAGDLLHTKMKICSWLGFEDSLEKISKDVINNKKVAQPFLMLALSDDPLLHKKASEIYSQDKYPSNLTLGFITKSPINKKIKIGYFSADFRSHPVSILTAELFELHDKNRFETIGFSFGIDDKSPMRSRISSAFSEFLDVSGMADYEIAKLARTLKIDIAVDLGGHTADNRPGVFAYRAAPVQLSYIGYLGTMGSEYYDYLLADKTIIPVEAQNFYKEKIFYLPSYQANDTKRIISDKKFVRAELGLPEDGFIFCSFNNNYKILPATFSGWMRILKAVEGSILFLYSENHWVEENLRNEAEARGIDGSRLIFCNKMPYEEYLARYRICDVFLDTFPYNAGTTASDALWMQIPVITLMGQSFASRMAASLLNAIGLSELITKTQEEYETLAIQLAMDPKRLADIKDKLASNRLTSALFNTSLFTKNLETAYIEMYDKYRADLSKDHIL